jgi:hypothetical protein
MHILRPTTDLQTLTIIARDYVYSSEDLQLYFERVILAGGTLEAAACTQQAVQDLDGLTVYLTDESANTTQEINPKVTEENGYTYLEDEYDLIEGTFYELRVQLGQSIVYRGKVFCTTQTDYEKYTVNAGQYKPEQTNQNNYIII